MSGLDSLGGGDDAADREGSDSAGRAWTGRELPSTGFDQDTGAADAGLTAALGADDVTFMAALAAARLLVPIVAAAQEIEQSPDGLSVEKSSQMAVVTLTADDGERALPVFTGMAALANWNPQARPRPVPAAQAAQAAVSEGCDVLVLELGSQQVRVVRPSMVWALAMQRTWQPAYTDPFVLQAVTRAAREEGDVVTAACEDGNSGGLRVVLSLRPGLGSDGVQELCARVGERIATDGEARARIDALSFRIVTAGP
ncbi:SseB family protein [Dermatophilaceae bacterium Sec6.4]